MSDVIPGLPARLHTGNGRYVFGWVHGHWAFLTYDGKVLTVEAKEDVRLRGE